MRRYEKRNSWFVTFKEIVLNVSPRFQHLTIYCADKKIFCAANNNINFFFTSFIYWRSINHSWRYQGRGNMRCSVAWQGGVMISNRFNVADLNLSATAFQGSSEQRRILHDDIIAVFCTIAFTFALLVKVLIFKLQLVRHGVKWEKETRRGNC